MKKIYIFDVDGTLTPSRQTMTPEFKDFSFENKKGDSETLAGFILEQVGFFPKKGYSIKVNELKFTINEVDRKRIKRVKVSLKK